MDKHYLTPLFQPESIAVFASKDSPETQTPQAVALVEALTAQRFKGNLVFLDIHTTGTLADLAQTRADLAVIALPPAETLEALEVAGRIKCRAALVVGSGIPAAEATILRASGRSDRFEGDVRPGVAEDPLQHVHLPRLGVGARGRAAGHLQQVLDRLARHRLRQEGARRQTGGDGRIHAGGVDHRGGDRRVLAHESLLYVTFTSTSIMASRADRALPAVR